MSWLKEQIRDNRKNWKLEVEAQKEHNRVREKSPAEEEEIYG